MWTVSVSRARPSQGCTVGWHPQYSVHGWLLPVKWPVHGKVSRHHLKHEPPDTTLGCTTLDRRQGSALSKNPGRHRYLI